MTRASANPVAPRRPAAAFWLRAALVRARFLLPILVAVTVTANAGRMGGIFRRLSGRQAASAPSAGARVFTCPMHPHVIRDGPDRCPECGMQLVEKRTDRDADRLALGESAALQAGVRLVRVERRLLEKEISAPATLEVDERRMVRVVSTVKGYVESVDASPPGAVVLRGQRLLRLAAPDIVGSARELIREKQASNPQYPLARQRLSLAGLTERQIDGIERTGDPVHLDFEAPRGGLLLARSALVGDEVMEGGPLFTIADLSRLWIVARVAEADVALLPPGTPLEATVFADRSRTWSARVDSWEPQLDRETRTLGVRALLDNRALAVRPGMSARVTFRVALGQRENPPLTLPLTAIADDGRRQSAWRESGGVLERVTIAVGPCAGPFCAVTGLSEGDRVVAEGAFLVSAEARTTSGISAPASPSREGPHASRAAQDGSR